MNRASLGTIVGVILAVVIAWVLVDVLLKAVFFVGKLGIIAVVALIVFLLLRVLFSKTSDD